MKAKLIKTKEGYYLVDDSKIIEDQYYLAWENYYSSPRWVRYVLSSGLNGDKQFNIIASDIDLDGVKKLSLKNCQAIERGYDLDELALGFIGEDDGHPSTIEQSFCFKKGFQKSLEILGDKKFSERNVIDVVFHVLNNLVLIEGFDKKYLFPEMVHQEVTEKCKSLQRTEWDVEVEMEYIGECNGNNDDGCFQDSPGHNCGCYEYKPKLDSDGCLILKYKIYD